MASTAPSRRERLLTTAEEMFQLQIRGLMEEAERFFLSQQHLLRLAYGEASKHLDQLKYGAQFFVNPNDGGGSGTAGSGGGAGGSNSPLGRSAQRFSVPLPLSSLAAGSGAMGNAAGGVGGPLYGNGGRFSDYSHHDLSSATPLRGNTSPHFTVSSPSGMASSGIDYNASGHHNRNNGPMHSSNFFTGGFQVSGSNHLSRAGNDLGNHHPHYGSCMGGDGGISGSGGAGAGAGGMGSRAVGMSTPPNKMLALTTDSKSRSMSNLPDDGFTVNGGGAGEWASLSLANTLGSARNVSTASPDNTSHMMGSPQHTNVLSLDDLLARFAGAAASNAAAGAAVDLSPDTGNSPDGGAAPFFESLYEQLLAGSGEKSRSRESSRVEGPSYSGGGSANKSSGCGNTSTPNGPTGGSLFDRNTGARGGDDGSRYQFGSAAQLFSTNSNRSPNKSAAASHQSQAHADPTAATDPTGSSSSPSPSSTYTMLNSFNPKDVIPVDAIRSLCDQHLTKSVSAVYETGRPSVVPVSPAPSEGDANAEKRRRDDPAALGIDVRCGCQVLVEFKRKRVLQYDSDSYVPPGSYVVVGGDRGEDLGLVIYTWCEMKKKPAAGGKTGGREGSDRRDGKPSATKAGTAGNTTVVGIGLTGSSLTRSIGVGNGTVLRLATETEVSKLLSVQAELESRAVEVCGLRVLEHSLPMVIVDAEYQFDKKKLTFFYEAQQRLDFRDLVRDLYKTFRARIWMELVDN